MPAATGVGRQPEAGRLVERNPPRAHLRLESVDRVHEHAQVFCSLVPHRCGAGVALSVDGAFHDVELHWNKRAGLVGSRPVNHAKVVDAGACRRRDGSHARRADVARTDGDRIARLKKG